MELKDYQREVLADLEEFVKSLAGTGKIAEAFSSYWPGEVSLQGRTIWPYVLMSIRFRCSPRDVQGSLRQEARLS